MYIYIFCDVQLVFLTNQCKNIPMREDFLKIFILFEFIFLVKMNEFCYYIVYSHFSKTDIISCF